MCTVGPTRYLIWSPVIVGAVLWYMGGGRREEEKEAVCPLSSAASKYHAQLANMGFDDILDLTAVIPLRIL